MLKRFSQQVYSFNKSTSSYSQLELVNELVGSIRYGEPVGSTAVNSLMNSLVRLELVGSVTNY